MPCSEWFNQGAWFTVNAAKILSTFHFTIGIPKNQNLKNKKIVRYITACGSIL